MPLKLLKLSYGIDIEGETGVMNAKVQTSTGQSYFVDDSFGVGIKE
jgi:hypothetical protein